MGGGPETAYATRIPESSALVMADPGGFTTVVTQASRVEKFDEEENDPFATRFEDGVSTRTGEFLTTVDGIRVPVGYEILDKLGQGGMGVVYKARQIGLNRLVALKMIRDQATAHPGQLERFRIEGEAVARLRHPNIIQIHEIGESGGLPYFSLEYLEGGCLADRIAGSPQPYRFCAELMVSLARAVHAAHEAGIVHRDLKPQNVLFDRDGVPKVADFGLAKRLEVEVGLTLTNDVLGTPAYMAPEQALGKNREVGPAADIYALGTILYSMLTGRPPLQGTSWRETLVMVLDHDPIPPSKLQPKVPGDLNTITLKCLVKEPRNRYASARELADDLERFLVGKPIRARRTPAWERGWKWSRRHPLAASLFAITFLSLIGAGFAIERRNQAIRERSVSEERRIADLRRTGLDRLLKGRDLIAQGQAEEARVALTRLETLLQEEPRLHDLLGNVSAALDEARRRLDERALRDSDGQRLVQFERLRDEAVFQDARSVGLDLGGRPDQARSSARAALGVFGGFDPGGSWSIRPIPGTFSVEDREKVTSGCYLMLMVLAEAVAQPQPGEDPRKQALEALGLLDRASALRPPTRSYLTRRAACLKRAGDLEAARVARGKAEQMEPAGAFDRLLLGQHLYREGDPQGALRQFTAALQEKPDLFWAQCLTAIGSLNLAPPRSTEAWAMLNSCLQQKPEYGWLYFLRGTASGKVGAQDFAGRREFDASTRFADAESDFRTALSKGIDPGLHYALLMNRGVMRFKGGRTAEAVADFQEAIALDPGRYNAHASLATVFAGQGHRLEAIGQLDRAIERASGLAFLYRERAMLRSEGQASPTEIDQALGDLDESIHREPARSREVAADLARRGRLLLKLDRHGESLAACNAALAIDPDLVNAQRDRAAALLELGKFDDAVASCDALIKTGPGSCELHELRGLARVGRNDFAGAIEDYTQALALRAGRVSTLLYRGRAYLFANSPELAFRDFEEVVRLAPEDPEGYAGRAAAKVRLRRHSEAALDAEESLRKRNPTRERLYDAARTYAQATAVASSEITRRGRPALRESMAYESRAVELLSLTLEHTPAEKRASFWRDTVERDNAFDSIRRRFSSFQKSR